MRLLSNNFSLISFLFVNESKALIGRPTPYGVLCLSTSRKRTAILGERGVRLREV